MAYDVVINVGLGVYDGSMRLLVEQGAHNSARGADAAGNAPLSPKQEEGPKQHDVPKQHDRLIEHDGPKQQDGPKAV